MLDGLLGRGFSSKCKSSIKLTKTRINVIQRKRAATQKFLKKDIADLLANGLDINAYGRAEGLLAELNISSCYDFVDQCCVCILKQLSVMQKERECPEECKEALPTLMFAAARFADLPELRDLRDIFSERYGNSLESFVNQEFAEKLTKPPKMEKKLQLMQEIAQEFSIKWDFRAFEQKMYNPPASAQDRPKKHESFHETNGDGYKVRSRNDGTVPKRDNQSDSSRGRRELTDAGHKSCNGREDPFLKREDQDLSSRGRRDVADIGQKSHNHREDTVPKRFDQDLSHGRREVTGEGYKSHNSKDGVSKDVSSRGKREVIDAGYKPHNSREDAVLKSDNLNLSSRGRQEVIDDGYKPHNSRKGAILKRDNQDAASHVRRQFTGDGHKQWNDREDNVFENYNLDGSSNGRQEPIYDGYKLRNGRDDTIPKREKKEILSHERPELTPSYIIRQEGKTDSKDTPIAGNSRNGQRSHSKMVSEEEENSMKPYYHNAIPPPYVKPKGGKYETNLEGRHAGSDCNGAPMDPRTFDRNIANNRSERIQTGLDHVDYERQVVGPARVNGHDEEKEYHHQGDLVGDANPKPRSSRRRMKSPLSHDNIENVDGAGVVKRHPSGRRRNDARQGLHTLLDDDHDRTDEEEKMMDRLLMHYSKKQSTYEPRKVRSKLKGPPSLHVPAYDGESPCYEGRDHLNSELRPSPVRALSLPPEQTTLTEAARGPARATSFQPDMLNPAGHVHPKLPDYDDLAARFAALRKGR
ncbi:hypothetical protein HHK36_021593 [Tetracentron sinense]|uniref:Regulator of Vps4 activity in the MVB pathway protein n=1 Tax=Tetracentron sinense TaxID=13715 RepID=A0A834YSG1_TETSI|nr:hypothetical protein HHK36_021593 [Tetracentron sinense]